MVEVIKLEANLTKELEEEFDVDFEHEEVINLCDPYWIYYQHPICLYIVIFNPQMIDSIPSCYVLFHGGK
jgi:hypothetical protein